MSTSQPTPLQYHSAQWVIPIDGPPIEWGFLAIEGPHIHSVGQYADCPPSAQCPVPKPGSLITPGLLNTHIHLEQSFSQPIPKEPQQSFIDWLLAVIESNRSRASSTDKLERCRFGVQECLQSGVTCVNDIASGPESIQALQEAGLRAMVALEVFHPGYEPIQIAHWLEAYQKLQQASALAPLITLGLSPHALYNVSIPAWQALQRTLQPAFIHTHLAEVEAELDYLAQKPSAIDQLHQQVLGKTFRVEKPLPSPVQGLLDNHLLSQPTILAHAIHTSPTDRKALGQVPVGIAHCPRSNLALHGRTLRWADWESTNIPVGLGTDGRLSTATLDLREEARLAQRLHGWSDAQTLRALTLDGAKVLGQARQLGSLTPGKRADWVRWQAAPDSARHCPEKQVLEASTSVQAVMIDGQWRYERTSPC
ncbi:amidohydrolase family protein [Vampirovibrio chlorellavorus]|uniref:amidohydrolase family protein n=1 Tax=Vampirovibrio chlorellavorus TaxID=758823 RepID=UPI0026F09145|nr:amidohydrolase family protein [Vampirovibrio chlorellavorus]